MATTKKPTEDNKNILDESENADIVNEFLDENAKDDKGLKEVIKLINQNPDFAKELQAILAKFRSSSLIQTQAEILLLLKEVIDNFLSGNYSLDDENQLDGKQKEKLKGRLVEMSQILMQQNLLQVRLEQKETGVAKDKYEYIAPEAYNSLKVTLKRLVVYEMYKVLSPKRIAGETH
ncbi:MAG: DUF5394 family protein, partial [Rickettsiaceae bacterium]|nr:DUF5394 family protein [Rickettsiaceae bacterium]